jgi:hypothetical protein
MQVIRTPVAPHATIKIDRPAHASAPVATDMVIVHLRGIIRLLLARAGSSATRRAANLGELASSLLTGH